MNDVETKSDVDIVREAIEIWNRRDFFAGANILHPEVEWEISVEIIPGRGRMMSGREEVAAFAGIAFATFQDTHQELDECIQVGDRVVAIGRATFKGRNRRRDVTVPFVRVFTIRDGRIWRCRVYPDREEAIQAARTSRSTQTVNNVEIVRKALEAYNRRGVDDASTFIHPDVEWEISSYLLEAGEGVVRGRDEFVQFGLMLYDTFAECPLEPEELIDAGDDRVVAIGKAIFRSKPQGAAVSVDFVRTFELEEGMIRRSRAYPSKDAALAAPGVANDG